MPRAGFRRPSFRRLKVWQKCALIAVPFLVPIGGLLAVVVSQNNENIGIARAELKGVEYLRPVRPLAAHLAAHRGLHNRVLAGDKSAEAERARVAGLIDESVREVDAVDKKLGTLFKTNETKRWEKVKDDWAALRTALPGLKADDAFARHTDVIAGLLDLTTDVWEYSTLALDPVADTYYLQDVMIARGIPGAEDLGQLRGIVDGAARRKEGGLTDDEKLKVNVLLGQIEQTKAAVEKETRNAARANPVHKGKLEGAADEYRGRTDAFTAKVRAFLQGDAARANAGELFAAGTDAAAAFGKVYEAFEPQLIGQLDDRIGSYRRLTNYSAAGTLLGLLAVGVVVFVVTRAITRQVDGLNALFGKIAGGDYQSRAAVTSDDELGQMARSLNATLDATLVLVQSKDEKDEIQRSIMKLLDEVGGVGSGDLTRDAEVSADITGAIADSFNYTIEQLRKIIGRVQAATQEVTTAAAAISADAEQLAGGAEDQAGQIVGVSASLDQMAASIRQVSENAAVSATVARQALTTARQGNEAVRGTIDGMTRIREQAQETAKRLKRLGETSQEVGQIVQLIDDIADRTGILALNASIQAAAAGDAGRGFAVVAEEVERLAVRATDATKKIAGLVRAIQGETTEAVAAMERNIQEVVGGSKVAVQAGQSLAEIETVSGRLDDLIRSISTAAQQQAKGSDELAKSMTEINQITRHTATGTKQTAESVGDLARLADDLRASVSTFRLPAGMEAPAPLPKGATKSGVQRNGRNRLAAAR